MKARKNQGHYIFHPIMQWWILLLLIVLFIFLGASIFIVLASTTIIYGKIAAVLVLLFFTLYCIDLAFFTRYYLGKEGLEIHNQLSHYMFKYRSMREIRPGSLRSVWSFGGHKRFALSNNCLEISLSNEQWTSISVSPVHKQEFLNMLLQNIDQERNARTSKKER